MDFLRSAYSTSIYSFDPATGLNVPTTITWFRAPAGAAPIPIRHQYASYNWTKGISYPEEVGEIIGAPRPWSGGATPPGIVGSNH